MVQTVLLSSLVTSLVVAALAVASAPAVAGAVTTPFSCGGGWYVHLPPTKGGWDDPLKCGCMHACVNERTHAVVFVAPSLLAK